MLEVRHLVSSPGLGFRLIPVSEDPFVVISTYF